MGKNECEILTKGIIQLEQRRYTTVNIRMVKTVSFLYVLEGVVARTFGTT